MTTLATTTEKHRRVPRRGLLICCALAVALIAIALYFLNLYWPYRYRNVEPTLEKVFASQIKMDSYHRTYFPHPGFVANGLTLRRNSAPDLPPVGSVEHVRVVGTWHDLLLLRQRIDTVYADGLHVVIPPVGSRANKEDFPPGSSNDFEGPTTAVERFVMNDALFDILRTNGSRYSFPIKRLVITHLQKNVAIGYTVDMQTPGPNGHIVASGSFGPLHGGQLGQTLVTGKFAYDAVKLDGTGDLHGTLASTGTFRGNLAGIEAQAESNVAGFSVGQGRSIALSASSSEAVNALNGDILLHGVDLTTGRTKVHVSGQIAGNGPKVTDLDVSVADGRVQDLLQPFLQSSPPVVGPVRLHSHAHIAATADGEDFLDQLTMTGVFEIPSERLTSAPNQKSLTAFSQRAQGVPAAAAASAAEEHDAISSLAGAVAITKGVAHASRLNFQVTGASIEANGTFNLRNQTVDMHGELRMQTDISHVTTGFKSALLKPLAPFFRRKSAGAVVPIRMTGSPGSYKVGQNIVR